MRGTIILLPILALAGCTLGPEPGRPNARLRLDAPYANATDPSAATRLLPGDPGDQPEWWRTLRDPVLDGVVAGNLDLEVARIAGAAGQPTVNATASASRRRTSENGLPIGGGGEAGDGAGGETGGGGNSFSGIPGSTFEQYQVGLTPSGNSTCSARLGAGGRRRARASTRRSWQSPMSARR